MKGIGRRFIPLILICSFFSAVSFSAPRVGNGGGGWACKTSNGEYSWVKLVDLYEAEFEFGLTPRDFSSLTKRAIINELKEKLGRLNYFYNNNFDFHFSKVEMSTAYVDRVLAYTDDFLWRVRPTQEECEEGEVEFVQIANYTFDDRIIIQQKLWAKLSKVDQAALLFHEAFYSLFREIFDDQDSIRARKVVGHLFSNISDATLKHILDDEVFGNSTLHKGPLDSEILPYIMKSTEVERYIRKQLDRYCLEVRPETCSENIYFELKTISPNGSFAEGSVDQLKIHSGYVLNYQLRGEKDQCFFQVKTVQCRRDAEISYGPIEMSHTCGTAPRP